MEFKTIVIIACIAGCVNTQSPTFQTSFNSDLLALEPHVEEITLFAIPAFIEGGGGPLAKVIEGLNSITAKVNTNTADLTTGSLTRFDEVETLMNMLSKRAYLLGEGIIGLGKPVVTALVAFNDALKKNLEEKTKLIDEIYTMARTEYDNRAYQPINAAILEYSGKGGLQFI